MVNIKIETSIYSQTKEKKERERFLLPAIACWVMTLGLVDTFKLCPKEH